MTKDAENDLKFIAALLVEYLGEDMYYNFITRNHGSYGQWNEGFESARCKSGFTYAKWYADYYDEHIDGLSAEEVNFFKLFTLIKFDTCYDPSIYNEKGKDDVGCERYKLGYFTLTVCGHEYLFAYGPKVWKEEKQVFASDPFRNLRIIELGTRTNPGGARYFMNETEKERNTFLFDRDELIVAAGHAGFNNDLLIKDLGEINFGNNGIYVSVKDRYSAMEYVGKSLLKAAKEKAKILILPELSVDGVTLKQQFQKLPSNSRLKLIVAGSSYAEAGYAAENGEDNGGMLRQYCNRAIIKIINDGKVARECFYDKAIPFTQVANVNGKRVLQTEMLEVKDMVSIICFADCTVGVAICRDAMDPFDKHNPLHRYCGFVDVMLVISYNGGESNMFAGVAECLARWHNCATVYTNSCGAVKMITPDLQAGNRFLEVSFGLYPEKSCSSPTSVSGELTYDKNPFPENVAEDGSGLFSILNSVGIKYTGLTRDDIADCCKVYTLKKPAGK